MPGLSVLVLNSQSRTVSRPSYPPVASTDGDPVCLGVNSPPKCCVRIAAPGCRFGYKRSSGCANYVWVSPSLATACSSVTALRSLISASLIAVPNFCCSLPFLQSRRNGNAHAFIPSVMPGWLLSNGTGRRLGGWVTPQLKTIESKLYASRRLRPYPERP